MNRKFNKLGLAHCGKNTYVAFKQFREFSVRNNNSYFVGRPRLYYVDKVPIDESDIIDPDNQDLIKSGTSLLFIANKVTNHMRLAIPIASIPEQNLRGILDVSYLEYQQILNHLQSDKLPSYRAFFISIRRDNKGELEIDKFEKESDDVITFNFEISPFVGRYLDQIEKYSDSFDWINKEESVFDEIASSAEKKISATHNAIEKSKTIENFSPNSRVPKQREKIISFESNKTEEPLHCASCGTPSPYAESNQINGSFICYSCRN